MEYRCRYKQPFTLEQAISFDLPVITAEIQRLQTSLERLRSTQEQLGEEIQRVPSPTLSEAFQENVSVIGSQEERISILRLALDHKGAIARNNPHYDLPSNTIQPVSVAENTRSIDDSVVGDVAGETRRPNTEPASMDQSLQSEDRNGVHEDNEGVYL